jgi:hypothetical protein
MSILFSYLQICSRPVKLSIQGLQDNKAYLDELKNFQNCMGDDDELKIVLLIDGKATHNVIYPEILY